MLIGAGYFGLRSGNLSPPPALQGRCLKKIASGPELSSKMTCFKQYSVVNKILVSSQEIANIMILEAEKVVRLCKFRTFPNYLSI